MNKPNKQALIPGDSVVSLLRSLQVDRIPGYGGKLGDSIMAEFGGALTIGEITSVPSALQQLVNKFGPDQAKEIWSAFHGIEAEEVKARALQAVISAGKQFPGGRLLVGAHAWQPNGDVEKWISNLSSQLFERLVEERDEHRRQARMLGISVNLRTVDDQGALTDGESKNVSESGQMPPGQLSALNIANAATSLLKGVVSQMRRPQQGKEWGISSLFLRAGGFVTIADQKAAITRFFASSEHSPQKKALREATQNIENSAQECTTSLGSSNDDVSISDHQTSYPEHGVNSKTQSASTSLPQAKTAGLLFQMWSKGQQRRSTGSGDPESKECFESVGDVGMTSAQVAVTACEPGPVDPYAGIRPEDIDADFLSGLPQAMVDEILTAISARSGSGAPESARVDGTGAHSLKRPAPVVAVRAPESKKGKSDITKYFS
jgi:hypothetical protein